MATNSLQFVAEGDTPNLSEQLREASKNKLSQEQFVHSFPTSKKLEQVEFSVTEAKYFDLFNEDIHTKNVEQNRTMENHRKRQHDFRLNQQEVELLKKNGFVVVERLGVDSFGEAYYQTWSDELPVFITADSMLHAWHFSFDRILQDIEESCLSPCLLKILKDLQSGVKAAHSLCKGTFLEESVLDADMFLTVGLSLLEDKEASSVLGQGNRVSKVLAAVKSEQLTKFDLFGRPRDIDFSHFKVRGHYENTEILKKYFKAMMWCGTIDLRIAGNPEEVSLRELGSSLVLLHLLAECKGMKMWQQFDNVIQAFVGTTDSMTFAQLQEVAKMARIKSLKDVKTEQSLKNFQDFILSVDIGQQQIGAHPMVSSEATPVVLPRTFTLMGQKFAIDSWVLSQTVFDRVVGEDGSRIQRRVPSCLDAAFAVFKNNETVPEILRRMNDTSGVRFRDNLPYQTHLAALRTVVEGVPEHQWKASLYTYWLALLQELSVPMDQALRGFKKQPPQATRTKAWSMKDLNTQFGSWTELRHDTILYVKQGATFSTCCDYPDGYIEPRPHFWRKFKEMCHFAAKEIGSITFPTVEKPKKEKWSYEREVTGEVLAHFFTRFGEHVAKLEEISIKQANDVPLTTSGETKATSGFRRRAYYNSIAEMPDTHFIKTVMEATFGSGGSKYEGWYPSLFFSKRSDCCAWDPLVADVHTDIPDSNVGDPGCVLHQAVGNVHTMIVAIDNGNGEEAVCYSGPVFSHYEFAPSGITRKNDSEWRNDLRAYNAPPHPEWTKEFLVPGQNPKVASYRHKKDSS